ncbi:MAG: transporter substrate-binding domain-containing protein [Desulfocapsaceae bacterium]|nr:transporter substrate-binding domain-containing protein [Desulfocapsaceae bacterium]
MKKIKWMFVTLMIACLLPGCAQMGQTTKASSSPVMDRVISQGELRVGVSGDMPPMNFLTKEDKVIGMDVDLATMIADGMGVKLNVQRIDFSGLLPALESGSIDMIVSNMTMTPDRNLQVAFVGPYFISGKAFLTKGSSVAQAKGLPDINSGQFTFVALKESTSEEVIREGAPQAKLLTSSTQDEAIQMVIDGKADAMIADYPICVIAAYRNPEAGLVSVEAPITYEPIGIAVAKGDPHLLNWLSNFLDSLENSGYMNELREKWFAQSNWLSQMK